MYNPNKRNKKQKKSTRERISNILNRSLDMAPEQKITMISRRTTNLVNLRNMKNKRTLSKTYDRLVERD